jgi:UDP-N-acetylmuramyl pentapeptide synthase
MKQITNIAKFALLYYLRFFAILQLKKNNPFIIGVTGSVGKTSAKNAIRAVLKDNTNLKVANKANSETGIPLNILGLSMKNYSPLDWLRVCLMSPIKLITNWEKYKVLLVEMGVDSPNPPKNMEYLLTIIKPTVGVFLNAYPVHSQAFDHLVSDSDPAKRENQMRRVIAQEKGKLITSLSSNGVAILNQDDENVSAFSGQTKANVITFGYSNIAAVRIEKVEISLKGTWFTFRHQDESASFIYRDNALGKVFGHTFAAAISVGISSGLTLNECIEGLKKNFKLPKGRMSLIPGINDSTIIDSSYNSSTIPLIDALNTLKEIAPSRKIAVLGDMREMGQEAEFAHKTIAKVALDNCDHVILVGPNMEKYAKPILKEKSVVVANAKEVVDILLREIKPQDTILIKGSQNQIFLEYIVEKIMKNPQNADKLLCRRGEFWNQKRKNIGLD